MQASASSAITHHKGWVNKAKGEDGRNRYDFQFMDRDGYRVTIEGLSRSFNKEYWNYAKLISGVLRLGMPIQKVVDLVEGLNADEDYINTWKNGVVRALKTLVPDGTKAAKAECPSCGDAHGLVYKEGCLSCVSCGYKPKRSIRFVLFANEENGLRGGNKYAEEAQKDGKNIFLQ